MTTPRYRHGCVDGSKASGITAVYAWNVNFNNGNANYNNQDNDNYVRAVRPRECQGAASFRHLHAAWKAARRGKKPSPNQLSFDSLWIDGLLSLEAELSRGNWNPRPPTCFIAKHPKAREIHAPDFADRIVHHWAVPQLEKLYEPLFIYDAYSNRRGKGTHAAVDRLQTFLRQVDGGQGGGWYLQLDIANFFNSIHRPTLYALLKGRMERGGLPLELRHAVHALLRRSPTAAGVHYACRPAERARVPAHKRLEASAPGCGIAIGNLSSQFFANVYLNELDQFVKHALRARRYVRYVDDFVLVHESREQLATWCQAIAAFLEERLHLALKADIRLRPIDSGVDFLGYVIFPTHRLVRRRVVHHARHKLEAWERSHVAGDTIRATPRQLEELAQVWNSYEGHFSHAASWKVRQQLLARFPWLTTALLPRPLDHHSLDVPITLRDAA